MKEEIKSWLKSENHEREWLAEQLGVNKRTVDNWLSSPKEIPSGKLTRIKRLMEDDATAAAKRSLQLLPQAQFFSLEVDLPRFRAYSAAALAAGKTLEQWCIDSLNELAAEYHRTGQMPDIRETKSTVAGFPVRILEPMATQAEAGFAPLLGAGLTTESLLASISKASAELHKESPALHRELPADKIGLNEQPAKYTDFGGSHGDHDPVTHDTRPLRKAAQEHQEP